MTSRTRWLAAPLALALSACHCGNSQGLTGACGALPQACEPDGGASCGDHQSCQTLTAAEAADAGFPDQAGCHACVFTPRQCTASADCCPGQVCSPQIGVCFDCYDRANGACGQSDCQTDADCVQSQGPGHICAPFGFDGGPSIEGEPPSQRCTYPGCQSDSDCASGTSCFSRYCVPKPPCAGGCAAGTACAVTDDFCSAVPASAANCQVSCSPGSLLVFADQSVPTGVYDACDLPKVACTCEAFPNLRSTNLGEYSAIAQGPNDVWVSAYDQAYGDLVAFHFMVDGGLLSLDYIDGVPDGGPIVGNPNGPRGGHTDPGPNVGEFTSVAIGTDGQPRIAYYDVDNRALKYAQRLSDGGWQSQTVDGAAGAGSTRDVGQMTSIAIDANGAPAISYLELDGLDGGGRSALQLAMATSTAPLSAADWSLATVQAAPPPCDGGCAAGERCIDQSLSAGDAGCTVMPAGACATAATGCTGCTLSEGCVALGDGGVGCAPEIGAAATGGIPLGIGLESSLQFIGGLAYVAYGDSLHGALQLARQTSDGFQVSTLDGRDPATCANTGSVGRFPSLQVSENGTLAIAYQDETRGVLLYWTGQFGDAIGPGQRLIIDPGTLSGAGGVDGGEDTPQIVGANASLAFGPSGTAYVAYQNQTLVGLRLLSLPPNCGTSDPAACVPLLLNEWPTTPQGFFSSLALAGNGRGFISNAEIQASGPGVQGQLLLEGPLPLP